MSSYDEILYVIGAMIIFSLLTLQVNNMFIQNNKKLVEGEVEYNAISLAQDYVDRIKWMKTEAQLDALVNSFPDDVDVKSGSGTKLTYYVEMSVQNENITGSNVINKHVFITVRSKYLGSERDATVDNSNFVKMDIIKSFVPLP